MYIRALDLSMRDSTRSRAFFLIEIQIEIEFENVKCRVSARDDVVFLDMTFDFDTDSHDAVSE